MNEQHGKHLDQRIRQALDSLSDVPTPGIPFDAAKLWEKLRPDLATPPVVAPKRTHQVRWLVAASLVGLGLFLAWMQFVQPPTNVSLATGNGTRYVAKSVPVTPQVRITSTKKLVVSKTHIVDQQYVSRNKQPAANRSSAEKSLDNNPALATNVPGNTPVSTVLITPEPVESTPVVITHKAAPTYPKRRFRVVHQNELLVQDEVLSSQFLGRSAPERFVRVGVGAHVSVGSDELAAPILIPLTRKPTQY